MFVTLLIGMVLGAIIALQRIPDVSRRKPLSASLFERFAPVARRFATSFLRKSRLHCSTPRLPGSSWQWCCRCSHLPLTKTLIVLTFLLGLLPVIGNLISNTLITIVGLSLSIWVAGGVGLPDCYPQAGILFERHDCGGQISAKSNCCWRCWCLKRRSARRVRWRADLLRVFEEWS